MSVLLTAEQAQQIKEALMVATTPLAVDRQIVLKALAIIREAIAQEQIECPHGVTDGACKQCYIEATDK